MSQCLFPGTQWWQIVRLSLLKLLQAFDRAKYCNRPYDEIHTFKTPTCCNWWQDSDALLTRYRWLPDECRGSLHFSSLFHSLQSLQCAPCDIHQVQYGYMENFLPGQYFRNGTKVPEKGDPTLNPITNKTYPNAGLPVYHLKICEDYAKKLYSW